MPEERQVSIDAASVGRTLTEPYQIRLQQLHQRAPTFTSLTETAGDVSGNINIRAQEKSISNVWPNRLCSPTCNSQEPDPTCRHNILPSSTHILSPWHTDILEASRHRLDKPQTVDVISQARGPGTLITVEPKTKRERGKAESRT